jgi:hypothetical protein
VTWHLEQKYLTEDFFYLPRALMNSLTPFDDPFHCGKVFKFALLSLDFHKNASAQIQIGPFYVLMPLSLLLHPAKDRSRLRNTFVYSLSLVKGLF